MGKSRTARSRKMPPPPGTPPPADPALVPLTDDERRFVEEYLIDRVASAAYRRCFPHVAYSTAYQLGPDLRRQPNVAREIRAGLDAQRVRSAVRADKVIQELARIAFSDVLQLYDEHTQQLRHPRHIPYDVRKAIASIKVSRQRQTVTNKRGTRTTVTDCLVEYRLWNKSDALGRLMNHLGLNTEITPLEALLSALPRDLAEQVRRALVEQNATPPPSDNGKH